MNADMIPINEITFVAGPNIGEFAKTADITHLGLMGDNVHIGFTKRTGADRWPDNVTPGFDGPLQFSLGIVMRIDGKWYGNAPVELWFDASAGGGAIQNDNQIPRNWFYSSRWSPMNGYQPPPGTVCGFFVCAGDARNSFNPVRERSNIVTFTMPAPGQEAAWDWAPSGGDVPVPPDPPVPPPNADEALQLLRSIDATLRAILALLQHVAGKR